MRAMFFDVGAHTGETLEAVLDCDVRFDRIVCFEPASPCWDGLDSIAKSSDQDVCIEKFGLWNQDCQHRVFRPGHIGASIWERWSGVGSEVCMFRSASRWVRENVSDNDICFLKLNVEGAECDIVDELINTGELRRIAFTMIDFDVRKIASQRHRESETRENLAKNGYSFPQVAFCKDVMVGATHQDRIKNWIKSVGYVKG